jgi:enamine deaminase RidA (YjgF/YER057c/UK114 family)
VRQLVCFQAVLPAHQTSRDSNSTIYPFTAISEQLGPIAMLRRGELWSNAIRAGDTAYISGQVARPFEGGGVIVGKDEYEQIGQIFSRIGA